MGAAITVTPDGNVSGASLSDTSAAATGTATGIDGSAGADVITNEGDVGLLAVSEATAVGVELTIAGSVEGAADGTALSDASGTANAGVIGIDGGDGDDTITNTANILGGANATATAVDVGAEITVAEGGATSGSSLNDTSVTANAAATGISGGVGRDDIENTGNINLLANSEATGVSVSLTIDGASDGGAEGTALSDSSATANAAATGINSRADEDTILSDGGLIELEAASHATGVAASLSIAGSVAFEDGAETTVSGAAVSDSSATANSTATGINGGDGADDITNGTSILANVNSTSSAVSVSGTAAFDVGNNVEAGGEVSGAALSDSSATANVKAMGIDGGAGDDAIRNEGAITLMLRESNENDEPDASATSVAVGLSIAGKVSYTSAEEGEVSEAEQDANGGSVKGKALSDSSATANARAIGIAGGSGSDDMSNAAAIAADVGSTATAVSVSGSAAFDVGINVETSGDVSGFALSDSSATANAGAMGIGGGAGDDSIGNDSTGTVTLSSEATATSVAVGLNVAGKVAYKSGEEEESSETEAEADGSSIKGAALSDSSATANARAIGINGGEGTDDIANKAAIAADVDSTSTAVSVSGSAAFDVGINVETSGDVTGAALSDASARANAGAMGIGGGGGDDSIENDSTGTITLSSEATATSVAVGLNVAGKVAYKSGEEEEDSETEAEADGSSIKGAALSDSSATANANAIGISGGDGADNITNRAAILTDVDSTSTAVSVSGSAAFDVGINVDATGDVAGMALSDASATATTATTGIDGRVGDDTIQNDATGTIVLTSDADATGVAVGLNVSGKVAYKGDATGSVSGAALSDTSVVADAAAAGIDGGEGSDDITNDATIAASAGADATGVSVSAEAAVGVAFKGDAELDVSGAAVSKASTTANTAAAGIDAGENDDAVNNTGYISVSSDSDATGVAAGLDFTAAVAIEGDVKANVEGAALNDASVTAAASATGIDGGEGDDAIVNEKVEGVDNTGKIKAVAESDAVAVAASLDIAGTLSFKGNTEAGVGGTAVSDSSVTASADAAGIRGDTGDDEIDNAGDIELLANSDATGVAAGLNVAAALTFKGAADADVTGEAVSKADVAANAEGIGIDGGEGNDIIRNDGDITVMKGPEAIDASATGVAASLNITGNVAIKGVSMGSVSGSAMSEAVVDANAAATGISGGTGDDTIENTGDIELLPESDGLGVAASLNVTGNMIGEASGYSGTDSSVTASAIAIGIDGGEDNDTITNDGAITLMKQEEWQDEIDANSESYAASLDITGTMNGSTEGKALSKATSEAIATAIGIDGGSGIDDITNRATISGDVDSSATALSISANISVTGNGVAEGAALSDASAMASATAKGIDSGDDSDEIDNAGEIDMSASSEADSTAVSVSLTASMRGVAEGNAMADGSAEATSYSAGIDGGAGNDTITASAHNITTNAESSADATSVTVSGGGTVGLTTGASVSDSGATGEAYAIGIDGGLGNDTITTASEIQATSKANADSDATTVDVKIGAGVVGGYGLADSSATATANSTGIDGGDGADIITNTGDITAGADPLDLDPMALATAGSTNVTVGVAAGLNGGDAASKSTAIAEANALGIGSGSGADTIINDGALTIAANPLDAQPLAHAEADSTTVSIGITIGANNGTAASDSSTIARMTATGIDSGSEGDTIINKGAIAVGTDPEVASAKMAYASASSTTVDVGITLGADLGATSAEASAVAEATSTGISSGGGDDSIVNEEVEGVENSGVINVGSSSLATSSATAHEVKCSFGVSDGNAQSGAATLSSASAVGIDSGAGVDEISTEGAMTVKAFSEGIAAAKTNTLNFLSVGANLQSAEANSSATAEALALGIDGGADNDTIAAEGTLSVTADADVRGSARSSVIQGLGLGVNVLESQSTAATEATSMAVGIDGGAGNDLIINDAAMSLTSSSNAVTSAISSSNSGFNLVGASFAEAAANASTSVTADGTGIAGGEGIDEITSNEAISVGAFSTGIVSATSSVGAVTFAGSAGGKALSDASARLKASATGIDGGGADDTITSNDSVAATAVSSGTVSSSSKADADVVFGSASTKTVSDSAAVGAAEAAGISGGEGSDTITSFDSVDASAEANLLVTASSVSVSNATFGSAYASAASRASSEANTEATGISGGAGNDLILSEGAINSRATSTTTVLQTTVAKANATFGSAHTLATSSTTVTGRSAAAGISGGEGADIITSDGPITVESGNTVNTGIFVKSSSGPAKLDARTLAVLHAAGIDAGADNDTIESTDTILVKGVPRINSFTRNFGSNVQGRVGVNLTSDVKGIIGGGGDDTIVSEGDILVLAGSPETESTVTGDSAGGSNTFTDAALIGEDADELVGKWIRVPGDGTPDFITRVEAFDSATGEMTLRDAIEYDLAAGAAYTLLDFGSKTPDVATLSITVGGYVAVDASTTASVNATGIDGGDGYNDITNVAPVLVRARNAIQAGSVTVAGNINADMNTEAAANAVGIAGADRAVQSNVFDDSEAGTTSFIDKGLIGEDPNSIVGKQIRVDTGASAGFVTVVEAYDDLTGALTLRDPIPAGGIAGGDAYTLLSEGTAAVTNLGEIDTEAGATIDASNWYISYWGDANVETMGRAQASSDGMLGGDLNDSFVNFAPIIARSTASVSSTERVTADFGSEIQQEISFEAVSDSRGISSGAGDDTVINTEGTLVDVEAASVADVSGVTTTWTDPFLPEQATTVNLSDALADSTAVGLDLGTGNNTAYNYGDLRIVADAAAGATAISDFGLFNETNADADATAIATASGISAGDDDEVSNSGLIDVDASAAATSFAQGSKVGGDGQSAATEDSSSGSHTFIDESLIPEQGELPIPIVGRWVRFLSGNNLDFYTLVVAFNPDTGELTLLNPLPANLSEGDLYTFSLARDGSSTSVATATATGIDLHDAGNDAVVENDAEIRVKAFAEADTTAKAFGGQVSAQSRASSEAWGIRTGSGEDVIRNTELIDVESETITQTSGSSATETSTATGIEAGDGNDTVVNEGDIIVTATASLEDSAHAVGIETGEGDDVVINSGSIHTTVVEDGVSGTGIGISSGGGNDQLFLTGDSFVDGAVEMGAGDDALTFADNAVVTGDVMGGLGVDSVILANENTFTVSHLSDVERFCLNHGTLEVNESYSLFSNANSGLLQSEINYLGMYSGLLRVNGDAGLDGTVEVIASPYAYVDGDTFDILEANDILGTFATEVLPGPTPLLSFDLDYLSDPDIVQVQVAVESFTTVATNPVEMAIARYLDMITPSATGDLSHMIGTIQLMEDPDFGTTFSSLSPDSYDGSTITTFEVTRQYTEAVQQRLRNLRYVSPASGAAMQAKLPTLLLAYNGSSASIGGLIRAKERAPNRYSAWIEGFGQTGDQDEDDSFTGFDYDTAGIALGFDYGFNENLIAGVSLYNASTDVDLDNGAGNGDIESIGVSIYGTYFTEHWYVDTVLSYAAQDYDNKRLVLIDSERRIATSDHDGDAYSAFIEGGYNFNLNRWVVGPFASLQYIYLDEDSFHESGAGGVNLQVDDRQTHDLVSELGVRAARVFELNDASLISEVGVAWSHNFNVDDRDITASFVDAPGTSFTVEGPDIDDGVIVDAGLTFVHKSGWSTALKYIGEFRDDFESHGIIGQIQYVF